MCNSGEVEDERHFLLHCGLYTLARQGLIEKLPNPASFSILPDISKMQVLLNDPDIIKSTAQYIIDSFDKRSLHL